MAAVGPGTPWLVFWYGNFLIRQSRAAYGTEMVELHDQPFAYSVIVCDLLERPALATLRALPIARMEGSDARSSVAFACDGSGNAGIHPAAQEHHGLSLHVAHETFVLARLLNALGRRIP